MNASSSTINGANKEIVTHLKDRSNMGKNAKIRKTVEISWHAIQAQISANRLTHAMKTANSMNVSATSNALEVIVAVSEQKDSNAETHSTVKELCYATTTDAQNASIWNQARNFYPTSRYSSVILPSVNMVPVDHAPMTQTAEMGIGAIHAVVVTTDAVQSLPLVMTPAGPSFQ